MSLSKSQIIHIVIETIVLGALGSYCIISLNNTNKKITRLEQELNNQKSRNDILEAVMKEILNTQPPQVKKRVNDIVRNIRPRTNTIQQAQQPVQQQDAGADGRAKSLHPVVCRDLVGSAGRAARGPRPRRGDPWSRRHAVGCQRPQRGYQLHDQVGA